MSDSSEEVSIGWGAISNFLTIYNQIDAKITEAIEKDKKDKAEREKLIEAAKSRILADIEDKEKQGDHESVNSLKSKLQVIEDCQDNAELIVALASISTLVTAVIPEIFNANTKGQDPRQVRLDRILQSIRDIPFDDPESRKGPTLSGIDKFIGDLLKFSKTGLQQPQQHTIEDK